MNHSDPVNINRLAREGMRFDNCYVTNSICGPSRAVIQTGKYSHLNGFYDPTYADVPGRNRPAPFASGCTW